MSVLEIDAGMATHPGPKERNDDSVGVRVPKGAELVTKGVAAVVADGVSTAEMGKQASEICVQGFLNDYYDAPEAWTAATSGGKVLQSLNRWLYSLGQSHSQNGRGYLTTVTALVLKGSRAHVFHIGDTRVYRLRGDDFRQLTRDHAFYLEDRGMCLARAAGMDSQVEVESRDFPAEVGDRYLLSTDGVHGFLSKEEMQAIVGAAASSDFDQACERLCQRALEEGGEDNCSAALIEIKRLGDAAKEEHEERFRRLPFPPALAPGMKLDGYEVLREIQATSRSQTYLVEEKETGALAVMKTPSPRYEDDANYIERFVMEAWIGRKLKHPHLAASIAPRAGQNFLYTLFEYIEGESLEEWIKQNREPDIRQVVVYARQILQGLRAMHRLEMLHQDLKPSNVIIHPERGAVIIDYGSTFVAGIHEIEAPKGVQHALGTMGYSAPEYFLEHAATRKSDLFSLGVVVYEMLTGRQPYGEKYERCRSERDFAGLRYVPTTKHNSHVPVWIDGAVRKAVQLQPQRRYEQYSEFEYDLQHPNPRFLPNDGTPFMERNPVLFWKLVALGLAISQIATLLWWLGGD